MDKLQEMFGLTGLGRINSGIEQRRNENSVNRIRRTRGDGSCKPLVYLNEWRFSRGCERDIVDGRETGVGETFREIEGMAESLLLRYGVCGHRGSICCGSGNYSQSAFC
jgi:hypothetical protein